MPEWWITQRSQRKATFVLWAYYTAGKVRGMQGIVCECACVSVLQCVSTKQQCGVGWSYCKSVEVILAGNCVLAVIVEHVTTLSPDSYVVSAVAGCLRSLSSLWNVPSASWEQSPRLPHRLTLLSEFNCLYPLCWWSECKLFHWNKGIPSINRGSVHSGYLIMKLYVTE